MHKTVAEFAVRTENAVAVSIGRSYIPHPKIRFSGGNIKWYEDKVKQQCSDKNGKGIRDVSGKNIIWRDQLG